MPKVSQDQVKDWVLQRLRVENRLPRQPGDNRGPDLILTLGGLTYHVEAIAFSDRTANGSTSKRGKNQADFWKAFGQAVSRLDAHSEWGVADRIAIALPEDFKAGWNQRVAIYGPHAWERIGTALPELEV